MLPDPCLRVKQGQSPYLTLFQSQAILIGAGGLFVNVKLHFLEKNRPWLIYIPINRPCPEK